MSVANPFDLNGKVALVTGGYGGIGEAVSNGLGNAGAKVAVAGHNADKAAACAERLTKRGYDAHGAAFESTSVSETRRLIDDVVGRFGRLDILVNCVGLNREEKAEEVSEEKFDYVMDVNLKSAMYGTPDEIARNIEALRDAGAGYLLLNGGGSGGGERGRQSLRRFAAEVMPGFVKA